MLLLYKLRRKRGRFVFFLFFLPHLLLLLFGIDTSYGFGFIITECFKEIRCIQILAVISSDIEPRGGDSLTCHLGIWILNRCGLPNSLLIIIIECLGVSVMFALLFVCCEVVNNALVDFSVRKFFIKSMGIACFFLSHPREPILIVTGK